jgi:hypothetical protein
MPSTAAAPRGRPRDEDRGKGLVDRDHDVAFSFDGKTYKGFRGDTLASALLANDVRLVARSFKYHRPRGIWAAGSEEPNALVTVGRGAAQTPNVRATVQEIWEGMEAVSQNRWPRSGATPWRSTT